MTDGPVVVVAFERLAEAASFEGGSCAVVAIEYDPGCSVQQYVGEEIAKSFQL